MYKEDVILTFPMQIKNLTTNTAYKSPTKAIKQRKKYKMQILELNQVILFVVACFMSLLPIFRDNNLKYL